MILDQPDNETAPPKNKLRWLESLLISGILVAAIFRILHLPYADELSFISWAGLGLIYLFGFYWIDTPEVVNKRTTRITILYGVSLFLAMYSFLAMDFLLEYSKQITAAVIIFFISINYVDRYWSPDDIQVVTKRTYIRITIFSLLLILRTVLHH